MDKAVRRKKSAISLIKPGNSFCFIAHKELEIL